MHNRAFPAVASHEQEKPKSTEVQDFHNSSSWPLPLPLGLDQFVVHLLMGERRAAYMKSAEELWVGVFQHGSADGGEK